MIHMGYAIHIHTCFTCDTFTHDTRVICYIILFGSELFFSFSCFFLGGRLVLWRDLLHHALRLPALLARGRRNSQNDQAGTSNTVAKET